MNLKKSFVLIVSFITLSSVTSYAQYYGMGYGGYGYGGYGGMYGGSSAMYGTGLRGNAGVAPKNTFPEDFLATAGYFTFDTKEVVKRCKIKDKAIVGEINKVFAEYYKAYDKVSYEHGIELNMMKDLDARLQENKENREMLSEYGKAFGEASKEVRKKMTAEHVKVYDAMIKLLPEKEAGKWESYYSSLCSKKFFYPHIQREKDREKEEAKERAAEEAKKEETVEEKK